MARPSADPVGAARVAILGAGTVEGARLRAALAAHGVPGARVDLYATVDDEARLSEYDGEARMIQEPDVEEIADHDVVFVCESGDATHAYAAGKRRGVAIDLVGGLPRGARPVLVHVDLDPERASEHRGFLAVPHPVAGMLAELLRGIDAEEVSAVVLRPASDHGDAGVEELREQTVRLLSFSTVPVETFGRQLAFNVVPPVGRDAEGLAERIASEVASLLGWASQRITVRLLTVPVFYGHAVQARLRLAPGTDAARVRDTLHFTRYETGAAERGRTPLEVAGDRLPGSVEISEDGLGGCWLWAVSGDLDSRSAEQAVRLAERLTGLR